MSSQHATRWILTVSFAGWIGLSASVASTRTCPQVIGAIAGLNQGLSGAGGDIGGGGGDIGGGGGDIGGGGEDIGCLIYANSSLPINLSVESAKVFQRNLLGVKTLTASGFTGEGRSVVLIDSGLSPNWSGIEKLVHFQDFTRTCPTRKPCDGHSHGTLVADLVHQVAPGANIISLKVLDVTNKGKTKHVVEALKWSLRNRKKYNIRIINLSLVTPDQVSGSWDDDDDLRKQIHQATQQGITVVVPVGNDGAKQVNLAPANSPDAITVGSFTHRFSEDARTFRLSHFSNQGFAATPETEHLKIPGIYESVSRRFNGFVSKPEVLAPGENVIAEFEPNSFLARKLTILKQLRTSTSPREQQQLASDLLPYLDSTSRRVLVDTMLRLGYDPKSAIFSYTSGTILDDRHALVNGTSFASALVAGGVALLDEAVPKTSPEVIKQILSEFGGEGFVLPVTNRKVFQADFDTVFSKLK